MKVLASAPGNVRPMALHIHLVCDFCPTMQPASFDALSETFGDLVESYRSSGWKVTLGDSCRVIGATCPDCPPKDSPDSV